MRQQFSTAVRRNARSCKARSPMQLPGPAALSLIIACITAGQFLLTEVAVAEVPKQHASDSRDFGTKSPLPLPHQTALADFEKQLFEFLNTRKYVALGWKRDKAVRDTGPYIDGKYYGTHPAVRVFYSPEMMEWLVGGRQGPIRDGAMLIKEQYDKPAMIHDGKDEDALWQSLNAWTIMIKDSTGSHDGWFWSNPQKDGEPEDNHTYENNFHYPASGFGHYCVRCHASTTSPGELKEFTFASLRNIEGFPGEPLLFRVDDSWRVPEEEFDISNDAVVEATAGQHGGCSALAGPTKCNPNYNQQFADTFAMLKQVARDGVQHLPPVTHDWVVRAAKDRASTQEFLTSNQCMSCHAAMSNELGPSMFVHTTEDEDYGDPGRDFSPYGEWRWTPMGLAGRDPVFMAQMESELAILKREFAADPQECESISNSLSDTCLRCHGTMGHRQYHADHPEADAKFTMQHLLAKDSRDDKPGQNQAATYGALARDGVSCMVCHRIQPRKQPETDHRPYLQYFLETSITGNYHVGEPGEIYGPFQDKELAPYAMEHGMGLKPKFNAYTSSSQMCGSCHTVNLPIVDRPFLAGEEPNELSVAEAIPEFQKFHHHVEQATYLEWLNSEYENEFDTNNPSAQSCQDCHMSRELHDPRQGIALNPIRSRIANIQDSTYPDAENLASHEDLNVRLRDKGYARHNFSGLNVFLAVMFNQFDDVLGVRKRNFMTGTEQIPDAVTNFMQTAREKTATLRVEAKQSGLNQIEANVAVQNKAGHRFPSGVGFRRAFLEVQVIDATKRGDDAIVWASGRTNALGMILGSDGQPLASEFFEDWANGPEVESSHHGMVAASQRFQPHHEVITSADQAQIYETLLWNEQHQFSTSFVHGCDTIKDNRLLPRGWKKDGPDPALTGYFLKATHPGPVAGKDARYADGSGSDETTYQITLPDGVDMANLTVQATLYYQAIPPYFLKSIFDNSDGPAAQRLHHICTNLKVEGTPIEDWKLKVTSAESGVTAE